MEFIKKILFNDETIISNSKNVADYRYVKTLRLILTTLNAWPAKEIGENHSKYMGLINAAHVVVNIFCLTSGILYMWLHLDTLSFYELGHMYITVLLTFVTSSRIILTLPQSTKYRDVASAFFTKMHLYYHKDVSEFAMKTHKKIHLISHIFTLYLTGQMIGGLCLFNMIPMWNNLSSGKYKEKNLHNSTYEHSIYLSMPINIYTDFNAYLFGFAFNWLMSYLCSTMICMLDLLLSLMVFHLWGHLKILLHDLETFPLPANKAVLFLDDINVTVNAEMYSEEELKQISQKLKQCIDYHRVITDFTNKISEAFGPMLFVYYAFHQVSGCLLLLECSQMTAEALMRYLPLSVILFQQLIQLSVIFELIGSTSEKLKDAVYAVPWQFMDTKNRRTVAIFLFNVQKPIHVKALGVVDVGVTTMATILKTSVSYFTFLRSM